MKYFISISVILIIGCLLVSHIYATYDDPAPGGVGRNKSEVTLKQILDMLLGGSVNPEPDDIDNPDPDPTGAYPTPTSFLTPIPTNIGTDPVDVTIASLKELYSYVGNKVSVPPCVIEAVSFIEYPTVNTYSPEVIKQAMQPGNRIPNCPWNSCSAAGHMQMTTGIDEKGNTVCNRCCWNGNCLNYCPNAWASYGNAVQQFDGATHTPDVCNLRDATFGAAKKLKNDSGTATGDMNWSHDAYFKAGKAYYGNCTVRYQRLGNRTYCEYLAYNCSL